MAGQPYLGLGVEVSGGVLRESGEVVLLCPVRTLRNLIVFDVVSPRVPYRTSVKRVFPSEGSVAGAGAARGAGSLPLGAHIIIGVSSAAASFQI